MPQTHSLHARFFFLFLMCIVLALRALPGAAAAPLLQVSGNGRYLATPTNQPFFLVGDTAWSLALSLTEAEASFYLTTRESQGFNTVFMDAVGLSNIVSGVATDRNGNAPFNGTLPGGQYDVSTVPAPGDNTSSAGRYWQHVDNLITMANNLNIEIALDVYDTYCPWFQTNGRDGNSPSSTAKLQAYGQFLGQRYGGFPNIIWVFGNDYLVTAEGDADMAAVMQGIRQFDTVHPITLEMDSYNNFPPAAFDSANLRPWLTLNGIYLYNTGPYRSIYLEQYNRSDFGPVFNSETGYELNSGIGATPATVRLGHYVMLLSGSLAGLAGMAEVNGSGAHSVEGRLQPTGKPSCTPRARRK